MKRNKTPRYLLRRTEPYLWILPSIVLMFIFIIIPIFSVFRMAFSRVTKTGLIKEFIWFDNFTKVLTSDKFLMVLKNTAIVIGCVLCVGVFIWLFDIVAGFGIDALISVFH